MAAPARLPGFHTCVGSGGDRQAPEWYTDNGKRLTDMSIYHLNSSKLFYVHIWIRRNRRV